MKRLIRSMALAAGCAGTAPSPAPVTESPRSVEGSRKPFPEVPEPEILRPTLPSVMVDRIPAGEGTCRSSVSAGAQWSSSARMRWGARSRATRLLLAAWAAKDGAPLWSRELK